MNRDWTLTQEDFDRLLAWLDPERDKAGQKYEMIRLRLVKIFTCWGCHEAEDLADETINRVTTKVNDIAEGYEGDPALYFYGVAHKVHLEYLRRKPPPAAPLSDIQNDIEQEYECLERCMEQLSTDQRELILQYYREDKRAKIELRKKLAQRLGIALNALRIRVHKIREILQRCVQRCIEQSAAR